MREKALSMVMAPTQLTAESIRGSGRVSRKLATDARLRSGFSIPMVFGRAFYRWDGDNYGHSSYWYRWNQVRINLGVEGEK